MAMDFFFSPNELQLLIGDEEAQHIPSERLEEMFLTSSTYNEIIDDIPLRILVAHKGVGKSAIFKMAQIQMERAGKIIANIDPHDVVNIPVSSDSHFVQKSFEWQQGLRAVIIKKICETQLDITDPGTIATVAGIEHLPGLIAAVFHKTPFICLAKDHPSVVEAQRRISELLNNNRLVVFIDDLDLGWHSSPSSQHTIERIATLLHAINELKNSMRGVLFRVSIRSDIFYLVRMAYVDLDKVRQHCVWHRWSERELLVLFAKCILSYRKNHLGDKSLDAKHTELELRAMSPAKLGTYFLFLMEQVFDGEATWKRAPMHSVILTVIRKRPRDVVTLITAAAREMRKRVGDVREARPQLRRIVSEDLIGTFPEYSQAVFNNTINEYRGELPTIDTAIRALAPSKQDLDDRTGFIYSTGNMLGRLESLITAQGQRGHAIDFDKKSGRTMSPENLLEFLYRINFLVMRHEDPNGRLVRREYFDESMFDMAGLTINGDAVWEIHPAFRWVLSGSTQNLRYHDIDLSPTR